MAQGNFPIEGVELQSVKRLAADYRNATGLPLFLADPQGRTAWTLGRCALCDRLRKSRKMREICCGYRRKAVEEAFRWGEPYISACPFGLVTFAVPISRDARLAGGLLSGFSILPQMEKDIREEVLRNLKAHGIRPTLGPRARMDFRIVPSEVLRRNANLLFELTGSYRMNDLELINESRQRSIQQFTIANYLEDAREGHQDLVASLVRMQNEIIDKVVLGDLRGSREIINRFLGAILLQSGMSFELLKVRLLELIVIISRAAIEQGISAEGLLGPRYSYLTDVNAASGFDELFWKVTKVLENFNEAVSAERGRKTRVHMTKMREYVRKNLTMKVAAGDVAASAGLSVSRALHLFRKESGMPLSTYISRQRIDYAKYLLRNTDRRVASIASECGFFDQSHFAKAFSALEGMPPSRYRARVRGS